MGANASPYSSARTVGHPEPIREPEQLLIPEEIHWGLVAGISWAQQRKGKIFPSVVSDAGGPRSATSVILHSTSFQVTKQDERQPQ